MEDKLFVAREVRRLIAKINKSTAFIAGELNVSAKTLNRWYTGSCLPSLTNYVRLCHLCNEHAS
ncbi:MAG: hypothetical protein K2J16_01040 [Clostridia bacterium]|nr:hypothetical protein [Clostridia bacterium]